jgi:hypothetical protein
MRAALPRSRQTLSDVEDMTTSIPCEKGSDYSGCEHPMKVDRFRVEVEKTMWLARRLGTCPSALRKGSTVFAQQQDACHEGRVLVLVLVSVGSLAQLRTENVLIADKCLSRYAAKRAR